MLYLQRSSQDDPQDNIWQYLGASIGCAVANYLGNEEQHLGAIAVILATLGYIFYALRPFEKHEGPKR